MIQLTLKQATEILDVSPINSDAEFKGFSIDTRTLQPENLFIAIPGANVDGHSYIKDAELKGAAGVLVDRPVNTPLPQIQVDDTVKALGELAHAWRLKFDIPFVAITGSNGKTTTKNMIASIMRAACQNQDPVLATHGNLNNHLGLPLTLGQLNHNHRYAAIEMGMSHFGEIAYLTRLTNPDVALITNAGAAHLAGLGGNGVADVARAKAEIFLGLQKDGIAVLNRDDAFYDYWREQIGDLSSISFGFHPEADISIKQPIMQNRSVTLLTPKGEIDIHLSLIGQHNILNMLAAAACSLAIDLDLASIKKGLEKLIPAPGRLQLHHLANGVNIIDDSYNANPYSLVAAINTLASFNGKKILVLGDMKELGDTAKHLHHEAGQQIRDAGIDYLFTLGELSENAAAAFGSGAYHFKEQDQLINALKPFLYNQTTILIKGSRSMRMEKIVAELRSVHA